MAYTLDPESSSYELSRIVLRDLGLTSHLLRVANSAIYNHSGRPILDIRHAMTLLGWEAVHNLVGAVRYIEHFATKSPSVRELVLLSVLTASHSKHIAHAIGFERPEEAYLCALFRNVGEVLVACYLPEEYSRILLTMHEEKISSRAAALRVLDFCWDDLGRTIAEAWNMPSRMRICLGGPEHASSTADRSLVSIANYGHLLTQSLYRDGERFDQVHLRSVLNGSGQPVLVSVRDLRRVVDVTVEETRQTFSGLFIPIDELRMEKQVEKARVTLQTAGARQIAMNRQELDQLVRLVNRSIVAGDFELSSLIQTLLEGLPAVGFDRAIFGFVTGDSLRIRGRLGFGLDADALLASFDFPTAAFPLDDRFDDGSLLVQQFNPGGFVLLPVIVERKLAGCLYADRQAPATGMEQLRLGLIRARDLITTAIRQRVHNKRTA